MFETGAFDVHAVAPSFSEIHPAGMFDSIAIVKLRPNKNTTNKQIEQKQTKSQTKILHSNKQQKVKTNRTTNFPGFLLGLGRLETAQTWSGLTVPLWTTFFLPFSPPKFEVWINFYDCLVFICFWRIWSSNSIPLKPQVLNIVLKWLTAVKCVRQTPQFRRLTSPEHWHRRWVQVVASSSLVGSPMQPVEPPRLDGGVRQSYRTVCFGVARWTSNYCNYLDSMVNGSQVIGGTLENTRGLACISWGHCDYCCPTHRILVPRSTGMELQPSVRLGWSSPNFWGEKCHGGGPFLKPSWPFFRWLFTWDVGLRTKPNMIQQYSTCVLFTV